MKKIKKIAIWSVLILGVVAVVWNCSGNKAVSFHEHKDYQTKTYKGADLLGKRMTIAGKNGNSVYGIYYANSGNAKTPLVINIHGGAFVKGSADDMDVQSKRISQEWGVAVYNLDYTLVPAMKLFGSEGDKLVQNQVDEAIAVVKYFKQNANKYNIDPDKIILLGYSSGGYVTAAATLDLAKENVSVWGQIIAYGFIKDALERYEALPQNAKNLTHTLFVFTASNDPISEGIRPYYDLLKRNNVNVSKLEYTKAHHAFMEEYTPEDGKEQGEYVRQVENEINKWIKSLK